MKLAVLYSGGKDSTLALMNAKKTHEIACLVSIVSENPESYMYHTPNIDVTLLQSQAMGIPLIRKTTKGEKEKELGDLKLALQEAQDRYGVEGVVTGAVRSTYQASRVQRICHELNVWCFNPLWLQDQASILHDVIDKNMLVIISGVFAEPFDETYLGRIIDPALVNELAKQHNPAGEGGEIETTVLDAPIFTKKITVTKVSKHYEQYSGVYSIDDARLEDK